jgi:TRAP-type C4-dicarboxylate transport system permease large subunit
VNATDVLLFIASYRFEKPVMTLYRATIPFFLLLLIAVPIIAYGPVFARKPGYFFL